MRKIVLTGGGTGGHVYPHIALFDDLKKNGFEIHYVGTGGMEYDIIAPFGIPFHRIVSGKLRRYFTMKNFIDVFRVFWGFVQSFWILLRLRPAVVFSKGGFVAVPPCYAAKLLGIPVITHESDLSPGLATKLISRIADKVFYTFEETGATLPSSKSIHMGSPVRKQLSMGSADRGWAYTGLHEHGLPVLLVMGGSSGAQRVNQIIEESIDPLLKLVQVVHVTGKGKAVALQRTGYFQVEYLNEELADVLAVADVVVSRAGANAIFEFVELKKPMLLIPLVVGSRGDQVVNAESFVKHGWALSLDERALTTDGFISAVQSLLANRSQMVTAMNQKSVSHATREIVAALLEQARK